MKGKTPAVTWRRRAAALLLSVVLLLLACDDGQNGYGPTPPEAAPTEQEDESAMKIIGGKGREKGQFVAPRTIAVAPDDSIWVADETGRIQHLDPSGNWLGECRVPAIEKGKPWGLTVAKDGRVLVTDTHYHRIDIFSPTHKLLSMFGSYGTEPGQFIYPVDVEIGPGGVILVAEYGGNDRINLFDPQTHRWKRAWGTEGEGPGEFRRPSSIAWDARRRRLYVADAINHRIQVLDENGRFVAAWGRQGRSLGEMSYPYGIALGPKGNVWVAEFGNHRAQCWSPQGKALLIWGEPGRKPGEFHCPRDVGVDSKGRVYVVEENNNRVTRFTPELP